MSTDLTPLEGNVHELKTWPEFFMLMESGRKPFELRKNDRNFQVNDVLLLREYLPIRYDEKDVGYFTGKELTFRVTLVVRKAPGLPEGYCIMAVEPVNV